ncbi:hypothetical protein LG634_24560 [Streptomyces bambusae]|uniref:hypothetical protein n=1 Tax=Streptomyces bambusae TaxID=1550616 RepID=UPI001CFE2C09|nr:hypothetical protein [Streptomyces bambusae]MCB5167986.1 hypothetical protein [Streptomyces bambusae]
MLAALWRHLQWRGLALAVAGAGWVTYGIGLLVTDRPGLTAAASPILRVMCLEAWGAVWIACGAICLVTALLRPGRDAPGFAAAVGPPLIWGLAYVAAAVTGAYEPAWASVPVLGVVVVLVWIIGRLTGGGARRCTCERGVPHGR